MSIGNFLVLVLIDIMIAIVIILIGGMIRDCFLVSLRK